MRLRMPLPGLDEAHAADAAVTLEVDFRLHAQRAAPAEAARREGMKLPIEQQKKVPVALMIVELAARSSPATSARFGLTLGYYLEDSKVRPQLGLADEVAAAAARAVFSLHARSVMDVQRDIAIVRIRCCARAPGGRKKSAHAGLANSTESVRNCASLRSLAHAFSAGRRSSALRFRQPRTVLSP